VIEKLTLAMVIIDLATVASSAREPSGLRLNVHGRAMSTPGSAAVLSRPRVRWDRTVAPMSFAVRNFTIIAVTGKMNTFTPFFSPQIPFTLRRGSLRREE